MPTPAPRLLAPALVALAAAAPLACGGFLPGGAVAPPPAGPSHPATTEAEWTAIEARARGAVEAAGTTPTGDAIRLAQQAMTVDATIAVAANHCYDVALAWGFPRKASVSVSFGTTPSGQPVNGQLGGRTTTLDAPGGVVKLCADLAGDATILVAALDDGGAMATSELLEYALVVGAHAESKVETTARRDRERAEAEAGAAKVAANIAEAEARAERNRRETAQVVQSQCGPCRDAYRACQIRRADTPRSGVTYGADQSCENDYQACQFKYGGDVEQNGEWPCGEPDR